MSLTALAIRLATIRALRGRTYAEGRVFDSKISPIELIANSEAQPVIIVSTDDHMMDAAGRDLVSGDHRLELVIEIAVTSAVRVEVEDGSTVEELAIPASDEGLEATLAILGWQIAKCLAADGGEWGNLWRMLVMKVHNVSSRRGADDVNGVRYAARQYVYTLDHVSDPAAGVVPDAQGAWGAFLAAVSGDPELAHLGRILETEIAKGDYMPWEVARGALGLANDEASVLGMRPAIIDEAVALEEIGLPDGVVINQDGEP